MDWEDMCRWIKSAPCGYYCLCNSCPVEDSCRRCSWYEPNVKNK